jgi:uncharacterized protein YabE (DUF348 family)
MQISSEQWGNKKTKYTLIISACILIISCIGLLAYWVALDRVTLEVDGHRYQWLTVSSTVGQVLREKNVSLKEGDEIKPALESPVTENLAIQVTRSFPVTVSAAGKTTQVFTISRPVREVLARANITYDADDRIVPGADELVQPNQKIQVVQITTKVENRRLVINPATEYRKDRALERGVEKVIRKAQPGIMERQVKVVYEDGRPVRQIKLMDKVIKPALNGIIAVGVKPLVQTLVTSRGTYRYIELRKMEATAYYPGPESTGKYAAAARTYTGKRAGFGLVAVDRRVIPLGTKLYIEGYGKAEAADIGAAIKGNRIDLCFETYREAIMFGRKKVKVYILE